MDSLNPRVSPQMLKLTLAVPAPGALGCALDKKHTFLSSWNGLPCNIS